MDTYNKIMELTLYSIQNELSEFDLRKWFNDIYLDSKDIRKILKLYGQFPDIDIAQIGKSRVNELSPDLLIFYARLINFVHQLSQKTTSLRKWIIRKSVNLSNIDKLVVKYDYYFSNIEDTLIKKRNNSQVTFMKTFQDQKTEYGVAVDKTAIIIWNGEDTNYFSLPEDLLDIKLVKYLFSGRFLFTFYGTDTIYIINFVSGEIITKTIRSLDEDTADVYFLPVYNKIIFAYRSKFQIVNVETLAVEKIIDTKVPFEKFIVLSNGLIAAGNENIDQILLWDINKDEPVKVIKILHTETEPTYFLREIKNKLIIGFGSGKILIIDGDNIKVLNRYEKLNNQGYSQDIFVGYDSFGALYDKFIIIYDSDGNFKYKIPKDNDFYFLPNDDVLVHSPEEKRIYLYGDTYLGYHYLDTNNQIITVSPSGKLIFRKEKTIISII